MKDMVEDPEDAAFKIGKWGVNAKILGIVRNISDLGEFRDQSGRARDNNYHMYVDMYRFENAETHEIVGTNPIKSKSPIGHVDVYISTRNMGVTDSQNMGVFCYVKKDNSELKTTMMNLSRIVSQIVGIIGHIQNNDDERYTHFMNHVEKVKIFQDPDEVAR